MFDIFESQQSQLSVFTPLDALFSEYRAKKAEIEKIASFVVGKTDIIGFFLDGAQKKERHSSLSAQNLFDHVPAIAALDALYWSRAMSLTDVLEAMDATRRNEWHTQIYEHKTPSFEPADVITTIRQLLAQRDYFFAQRVEGIFTNLSQSHVTNEPQGFGKKMIIAWMLTSYGSLNSERVAFIHDLRCVIAKFSGRGAVPSGITYNDIDLLIKNEKFGEWHSFDGGAFRAKFFKKGTAHLEISPDVSYRLNQVLAFLYPAAIPSEFRRKPVKAVKQKNYVMEHELVSFDTIASIGTGRISSCGFKIFFNEPPLSSAIKVMEYLGGLKIGNHEWFFDYKIHLALNALRRTGSLPEQVTHQFYATPENVARMAVEMADIGDNDMIVEPSAGQGGIAVLLPIERTVCVEISQLHCAVLRARGLNVIQADFLEWNKVYAGRFGSPGKFWPKTKFDRCVMNPPFSGGRAVAHVTRACDMLNDNGILVAVMPASFKGKEVVPGFVHEWSEVLQNEFDDTNVAVILLKLSKASV